MVLRCWVLLVVFSSKLCHTSPNASNLVSQLLHSKECSSNLPPAPWVRSECYLCVISSPANVINFTEIEAAKLLVYNAARLKDAGLPFVQEAAMAKLYASQVAEKVASTCVNMLGGVGFTKGTPNFQLHKRKYRYSDVDLYRIPSGEVLQRL